MPADSLPSTLSAWLAGRLVEERDLLERRHAALCESLRLEVVSLAGSAGCQEGDRLPASPTKQALQQADAPALEQPETPKEVKPFLEVPETSKYSLLKAFTSNSGLSSISGLSGFSSGSGHRKKSKNRISSANPVAAVASISLPTSTASPASERMPTTPTSPGMIGSSGSRPSLRQPDAASLQHRPMCERLATSTIFEFVFAGLIIWNAIVMAAEVEHHGLCLGPKLRNSCTGTETVTSVFAVLEIFFGIAFLIEVVVKICGLRIQFLLSGWNWFDTFLVVFWFLSLFEDMGFVVNPMILRVCRFARLFRLLRLLKVTAMFDTLVLMVSSIQASVFVLLWGIVLLVLTMTMCALVLNSVLQSFFLDDGQPEGARERVWLYFGTYTRSMVTMFEVTMASWVTVCRIMAEDVNPWFALFFVAYKCVVGFAVLKVITGVFLHETFRCASLDDDLMIQNRRRMRLKFKNKMLQFFAEADFAGNGDGGGDGEVSVDEFTQMIADDRVNTWLEAMDLRIRDAGAERVFAFLAGSDGSLSEEELVKGMSRLRGSIQGLDVITLLELSAPDILMPLPVDIRRLREGCSEPTSPRTTQAEPNSFAMPVKDVDAGSDADQRRLEEVCSHLQQGVRKELGVVLAEVRALQGASRKEDCTEDSGIALQLKDPTVRRRLAALSLEAGSDAQGSCWLPEASPRFEAPPPEAYVEARKPRCPEADTAAGGATGTTGATGAAGGAGGESRKTL